MVIDMQNDYLYEKRKPIFAYNTEELVTAVNGIIREYSENGCDVIYVRHIIQNLPTNRLLFGYSLAGTEGAELYDGLDVISDYVFDKLLGDALTNKELLKLVKEKSYDTLCLCGLDECGCVTSTALGASKRGIKAEIIRKGTATVFPEKKVAKARKKLEKAGVNYI
ncbi:MAG: cysteine hydrolase [Ruminiclostridium sp.]|nr:cysteine hydrolase [Ruminiclostridium sp.]